MTLTGITKGPKNRGKGEEKETKEGKRKEGCTKLEQWKGQIQMQPEILRSQNPFLSAFPELRQTHQDQAESSRKNCNQSKLIKLLMSMRQEMKERDDQLKTQLQLRDEYFDAELKRRDQDLEDALKKMDEEWRVEIEKKGRKVESSPER